MSDNFEERDFRMIKGLLNMVDFVSFANNFESSPIVRTKRGRDISISSTQSAIKKRKLLLSQSSLSIDDNEAKSISISHRYSMSI